ncbi:MAG: tetratricopeptide (TPR) repeat protein [Bradymonadia bacterium]|jgi:tetratricopeptide (TPR) repeat protein
MRFALLTALLCFGCDQSSKPGAGGPKLPGSTAPASAPASSAAASVTPASKAIVAPGTPTILVPGTEDQIEYFELGKEALDKGDEQTALKHFLRASDGAVSGASVSAGLAAANLHELRDRPDQAKAIFVRMVALAPGVPELRFAAARFFGSQRDTGRAIEGFEATIRHQPEFLPAYPLLAVLWMQAGKNDDATQLLLTYETKLNTQLRRLKSVDVHPTDKRSIIDLLALVGDERATQGLIKALEDPAPVVRLSAAGALGEDPSSEALAALAKAMLAEREPVVKQVMIAATRRARDAARADLKFAPPAMPAPASGPAPESPPSQ